MPFLTKEDTKYNFSKKANSTAIGNPVGDPPNNDLEKEKKKKEKILQQNEIGIT